MKKMLVLFLILFTTVLAESEEDKYVDLLSDEEKQQFLEKVARRILQDVESREDVTNARSGELNDDELKEHTEYVKSVLKEEQENVRRSKGSGDDEEEKPISQEKNLGVQPLASLKVSLFKERQDLTLRNERGDGTSDKDSTNNITIEVITDNSPIIKRSVQDDNINRSNGSDETTSEIVKRVSQTNHTLEKNIEVETAIENSENGKSDAKILSENSSEVVKSTNSGNVENGVKSAEEHKNDLIESNARNVSVKDIHEGSRRSNGEESILAENTTASTTVAAVEDMKSVKNKSDEYLSNVSDADEEFTTVTYPYEGNSAKSNDTESTTIDGILVETMTEIITHENKKIEPIMKSRNDTSKDTENGAETTKSVGTNTSNGNETTTSFPETTASALKTTGNVPETTNGTKIVRTEAVTEPTTFMTTEKTTASTVTVVTTKEKEIIIEDFPSATTKSSTVEHKILKPNKPIKKILQEITTVAPEIEQSIEVTTKKTINNKIVVHKPSKHIVGPRAKKLAGVKKDVQNENFVELEKVYYNNNKNVTAGKEYLVFEIPADESPFIKDKEPVAEQPYYVPIYNYSPNNAYYNPKNRLGPNPGDSSTENIFNNDDNFNQIDRTETMNVKMEYDLLSNFLDSKRKKFSSKHKLTHAINKQPLKNKEPHNPQGEVVPEDYLDSDYYFGRVRKLLLRKANDDFYRFPNSDETDHPAHSIQEGSLKDHVRAVRNILFNQKSFGLLEKDKYESIERELTMGRKRSENKETKEALRKGSDDDFKTKNDKESKNSKTDEYDEKHIAIDYYFGREKPTVITDVNHDGLTSEHFQKIGYLKKHNETKALYVMDDVFKANVEKYIEDQRLTPATPLPEQTTKATVLDKSDEINTLLRMEVRKHRAEKKTINFKRDVDTRNAAPNLKVVSVNSIERPSEKALDLKINVRRNDVVKVSVYLQVLNDMVTLDNKALVQYDWLGTTVDVQASLQKLFELTSLVANEEEVHPADMEILKYVLFLHKLASEIIEAHGFGAQLRNKLSIPRNMKKTKSRLQEEKGLINKVWLYLRKEVPEVNEYGALKQLNIFLMNVEDGLYDLHDAIKNIAKITKYKNQHWYQNLKDLYINTDEKHLLELLLHFSALRLFSLIEESAKSGLEDDYIQYMKQNRKHCKQTLGEMMFVMELVEEYKKFVE